MNTRLYPDVVGDEVITVPDGSIAATVRVDLPEDDLRSMDELQACLDRLHQASWAQRH